MIFVIPDKFVSSVATNMSRLYPDVPAGKIQSYLEDFLKTLNRPEDIDRLKSVDFIKEGTPVLCYNNVLGNEITERYGFLKSVNRDGAVIYGMDSVYKHILALDATGNHLRQIVEHEYVHFSQLEKGHLVMTEEAMHWTVPSEEYTMSIIDNMEFEKYIAQSTLSPEKKHLIWLEHELRKPWEMEAYFTMFKDRMTDIWMKSPKIHSMITTWGFDHGLL